MIATQKIKLEVNYKHRQIRQKELEKSKIFSLIAHDLKGPFQGFLGFTELLSEDLDNLTNKEIHTIADKLHNSAVNLFQLLENLLEWSRMQNGQCICEPKTHLLSEVVSNSIKIHTAQADLKQISLINAIPDDTVVYADHKMLQAVVRNLLSNAIKFSNIQGLIVFTSQLNGKNLVETVVSDTGIGMPENMIKSLFSMQVNNSRSGTNGELSTGLGLILCKEYIEKNHGQIWAESEDGKGSAFHFTLPNICQ